VRSFERLDISEYCQFIAEMHSTEYEKAIQKNSRPL